MSLKTLEHAIDLIAAEAMVGAVDRDAAHRSVLMAIQAHMQCSRVSIWRLQGVSGHGVMRCSGGYTEQGEHLPAGALLREDEYRSYFEQLFSTGAYVCPDTQLDPRLDGMRDSYLKPLSVMALLDVVFAYNGMAQGVLCCEQVGTTRSWTMKEVGDLKRCASRLTRHVNRWAQMRRIQKRDAQRERALWF